MKHLFLCLLLLLSTRTNLAQYTAFPGTDTLKNSALAKVIVTDNQTALLCTAEEFWGVSSSSFKVTVARKPVTGAVTKSVFYAPGVPDCVRQRGNACNR